MSDDAAAPGSHQFDVLETRTAYEGAILALRVDRVAMPGGGEAKREVVEHYGAVGIAAVDEDDSITLIRQYRHPVADRLWELPAGLLDQPGEDPLEGARRELEEETGLRAARWSTLVDVAASPGFTDEVVRIYLAEELTQVARPPALDEEADLDIRTFALAEAVRMALRGEIVNAAAVSGILALWAVRSGGAGTRPPDAPWGVESEAFARRRASGDSGS